MELKTEDMSPTVVAIITVDSPLDAETLSFLRSYREMVEVKQVKL